MAKKDAKKAVKKASPKKKSGAKKLVPTHTPRRKKQIQNFRNKVKVTTQHPYGFWRVNPPMYNSPEELAAEIDKYILWIAGERGKETVRVGRRLTEREFWIRNPEPPTITGLALFLGFASRQSLEDYDKMGGAYSYIIKRAKHFIAHGYEKLLHDGKPVGGIFALKNIDKWTDRVETYDETLHDLVKGFNYVIPEKPKDYDPRDENQDIGK